MLGSTGLASLYEGAFVLTGLAVFYLLTTQLGPGDYGYYVGSVSLMAVLTMLSANWVGQLLMQDVVRDGMSARHAFSTALGLLIVISPLALVAGVLIGSQMLVGLPVLIVLLFGVAELAGGAVIAVSASMVQAAGHFGWSLTIRGVMLLVRFGAVVVLTLTDSLSLYNVAVVMAISSGSSSVVVLLVVRNRLALSLAPRRPTRRQLTTGFSYATSLGAIAVQEDADKVLLVRLADPVVAGLYAAAYRGVQIGMAPVKALATASHRHFLAHDPEAEGEHVRRSLLYTAMAAGYGALAAVVLVLGAPWVPRILGSEYDGSVIMIQLLAPLIMLRSLGLFASNGLMGLGRTGLRSMVMSACAVACIALNVALIPAFSWGGAVVTTLLVEILFMIAVWTVLRREQGRHDDRVRSRRSAEAAA